jgi:hypothetical protein
LFLCSHPCWPEPPSCNQLLTPSCNLLAFLTDQKLVLFLHIYSLGMNHIENMTLNNSSVVLLQGGSNMTGTAAAQCGLFTHKSDPFIFEPPCICYHRNMFTMLLSGNGCLFWICSSGFHLSCHSVVLCNYGFCPFLHANHIYTLLQ